MSTRNRAVLLALLLVCSAIAVPTTFADVGTAQSDFDIEYGLGAGGDGPSPWTEDFIVTTTGDSTFEFGPDASRSIRIRRADTGAEVTLEPLNNESTVEVREVEINAGDIIEASESNRIPTIDIEARGENGDRLRTQINVSVDGDLEMFTENAFNPYIIEIVGQDGTVLAATEPQTHAVRYATSIRYNGSALAFTRPQSAQPGWYVELQQETATSDGDVKITEFEPSASGDYYIATTEGTEFNESRYFRIEIYENESDRIGDRLATLFLLRISEENRVSGPVIDNSNESESKRLPTRPGEPSFTDVLDILAAFNSNSGYANTGITPGFRDVLDVIQAFNAG